MIISLSTSCTHVPVLCIFCTNLHFLQLFMKISIFWSSSISFLFFWDFDHRALEFSRRAIFNFFSTSFASCYCWKCVGNVGWVKKSEIPYNWIFERTVASRPLFVGILYSLIRNLSLAFSTCILLSFLNKQFGCKAYLYLFSRKNVSFLKTSMWLNFSYVLASSIIFFHKFIDNYLQNAAQFLCQKWKYWIVCLKLGQEGPQNLNNTDEKLQLGKC